MGLGEGRGERGGETAPGAPPYWPWRRAARARAGCGRPSPSAARKRRHSPSCKHKTRLVTVLDLFSTVHTVYCEKSMVKEGKEYSPGRGDGGPAGPGRGCGRGAPPSPSQPSPASPWPGRRRRGPRPALQHRHPLATKHGRCLELTSPQPNKSPRMTN